SSKSSKIPSSPNSVANTNGGIGDSRKLCGTSATRMFSDFFTASVWNHFNATYPLSSVETMQTHRNTTYIILNSAGIVVTLSMNRKFTTDSFAWNKPSGECAINWSVTPSRTPSPQIDSASVP